MRPTPALAAAAFALLLAAPAQAFASMPPGGSVHDRITQDAAQGAGFPKAAARALAEATRAPDIDEMQYDPAADEPMRIDAGPAYDTAHHCDREPPESDAHAFGQTVAYVAGQRSNALDDMERGDTEAAVRAIGRALHALQDCHSHSNVVDLGAGAQAQLREALLAGDGDAPAGLRLTSFQPGADDPEAPEGDGYTHKEFAKDDGDGNEESRARLPDGRTKFEAAREAATEASRLWLDQLLENATAGQRADLFAAKPHGDLPDRNPIPAAGAWTAAAALLAWARFHRGPAMGRP